MGLTETCHLEHPDLVGGARCGCQLMCGLSGTLLEPADATGPGCDDDTLVFEPDRTYRLGDGEYHPLDNPDLDEWEAQVFGRGSPDLPTQQELDEFQRMHRDGGPLAGNAPVDDEEAVVLEANILLGPGPLGDTPINLTLEE